MTNRERTTKDPGQEDAQTVAPASEGKSWVESFTEKQPWVIPVFIGLFCYLVIFLLSRTAIIRSLEYDTYDWRTSAKALPLFDTIQAKTHYPNPNIAVVPIDNKTINKIDTPMFFWAPYFTKVINALIDNDAKVIALDFQFQISPDLYVKRRMIEILQKYARGEDIQIDLSQLQPYLPKNDLEMFKALRTKKVILLSYMKEKGKIQKPYRPFMYAAGLENLGLGSTEPDPDGVIRRYLLYRTEKTDGDRERVFYSISFLTASKFLDEPPGYDSEKKQILLGDKPVLHDDNFNVLINYVASTGYFLKDYSFVDLSKKAEQGDDEYFRKNFAGKAVLIGPGFTGSTDLALTPLNTLTSLEMFGIEVHANALNTFLNRDYIKRSPGWLLHLILIFIAVLTAVLCYYLRPSQSAIDMLLVGFVYFLLCFFLLIRYNYWLELAAPIAVIPLSFASVYAYRYVSEDREKRFIRKVLGRYISESVAREILKDPSNLALGGKRANVSILFCDINDFTTFSEKTPPQRVISILNDYFSRMEKVIFENRGTLKQFVGDEIMVICGAPQPDPDHAHRICNIAIEMVEELKRWQQERKKEGKFVFDVKFGIHSGWVVAGNVGSKNRTEYTTVGDVVNTASRIMGLTKKAGARILISEDTYKQVKQFFKIEDKGTFPVKGREEEVRVYQLLGKKQPDVIRATENSTPDTE